MRPTAKITAALITFFLLIPVVIVFIVGIKNISVDNSLKEYSTLDAADTIKVFRNYYGVPHITASNEHDLFFAVGYAQAQDRLWQMDFMRRAASGRLSEILGEDAFASDRFMRALRLKNLSNEIVKKLSKKSAAILNAYSDGVNSFIINNPNRLSFEFGALDYKPEIWRPIDCILIGRLMALQMSLSFFSDTQFGEIQDKIGQDKADLLIPSYPENSPFVLDDNFSKKTAVITTKKDSNSTIGNALNNEFLKNYNDMASAARNLLGINGSSLGSNSWAARKRMDTVSSAILAGDPHLSLGLPSAWMQIHFSTPDMNVIGAMIPGIPLCMIGRNDNISWSITNMMLDDADFFIERTDEEGKFYFPNDNSKKEIKFVNDTIKIRDKSDYVYYLRVTDRSVIISDAHLNNSPEHTLGMKIFKFKNKYLNTHALTYRWTGNSISDEIFALYKINKAKNINEFKNGLDSWQVPALNFTYADKYGNIAIVPRGIVPMRGSTCNPDFPNQAWISNSDWYGYHKSNEFETQINPTKKFVASANNALSRNIPYHLSSLWEPASRAERIEEMLSASNLYSARDAQYMQIDYLSVYAREQLGIILPVLNKYYHLLQGNEKEAFYLLNKWDFVMTQGSAASMIYNETLVQLLNNIFYDKLGTRLFRSYLKISNLPLRKLSEIMKDPSNILFDNVNTENKEERDYIIVKSFKDAATSAGKRFDGQKPRNWKYGDKHTLTLNHPFSKNRFLSPTVTFGPLKMGGNSTTLNNTEYTLYDPYSVQIGASLRFIADMSENFIYTSMPGGVSGDPQSPNYANQVQIWLNGGYIKLPFDAQPAPDFKLTVLINPE